MNNVELIHEAGKPPGNADAIVGFALTVLDRVSARNWQMSILFTDDAGIREYNRNWRNIDKATDAVKNQISIELLGNREIRLKLARAITGSLIFGILFLLKDLISGGGSPDQEKNRQMRKTGWQEYSINIGGKWISYKSLAPLNLVLAIIGNFNDYRKYNKTKDEELMSRTIYALLGIANTILDQSFLTGAANVIEMIQNRDEKKTEKLLSSLIANPSVIVGYNGMRYINDIFNPEVKNPETFTQILMNDLRILYVVGGNDKIPNRIDTFGNISEKRSPKTGTGDFILNSLGITVGLNTFESKELEKITNSVISIGYKLPASNGRVAVKIKGENYDLNEFETEQFLKYRGERFTKLLLTNKNYINKTAERINNGETHLEEILKRRLTKLHDKANDYGKNKVRADILRGNI